MSGGVWEVLYAVTRADARAGSAPARIITAAGLRAWGGADPARAGEVCVRLARRGGVLPARAGARIAGGPSAIRAWLRRSAETLSARLDEIDDRVEFVATLSDRGGAPERGGVASGAAYLRAAAAAAADRRAGEARLRQLAEEIVEALPPALRAAPRRLVLSGPRRADLSILAPRAAKAAFALGVADCAGRLPPSHALAGSGPWAPHSFASIAAPEAADSPEEARHAHRA